jgi:hypothetical protein
VLLLSPLLLPLLPLLPLLSLLPLPLLLLHKAKVIASQSAPCRRGISFAKDRE